MTQDLQDQSQPSFKDGVGEGRQGRGCRHHDCGVGGDEGRAGAGNGLALFRFGTAEIFPCFVFVFEINVVDGFSLRLAEFVVSVVKVLPRVLAIAVTSISREVIVIVIVVAVVVVEDSRGRFGHVGKVVRKTDVVEAHAEVAAAQVEVGLVLVVGGEAEVLVTSKMTILVLVLVTFLLGELQGQ